MFAWDLIQDSVFLFIQMYLPGRWIPKAGRQKSLPGVILY